MMGTFRIAVGLLACVRAAVVCFPERLQAHSLITWAPQRSSQGAGGSRPKLTYRQREAPSARRSWMGCAAIRKSSSRCII